MHIYIDPSIAWFVVGFLASSVVWVGLAIVLGARSNSKPEGSAEK